MVSIRYIDNTILKFLKMHFWNFVINKLTSVGDREGLKVGANVGLNVGAWMHL